jgi:hypothetical protein
MTTEESLERNETTMRERTPKQRHDPFPNDNVRQVVVSVVWRTDAKVGLTSAMI